MEIAGFIKNSFVDYPGVIASVVFTPFCNFRCWYCHNSEVICKTKGELRESDIFDFLEKRKGFIDGVVISGGEPTFQKDLVDFIIKIKNMGFKVKLDTNGTNLDVVKKLVDNHLLDYIAMDIKAPLDKYQQIVGINWPKEQVLTTIDYIKNCGVECEFRTTFSPDLAIEDIVEIAKIVGKNDLYSLQQYHKNSEDAPCPHVEAYVKEAARQASLFVKDLTVKGLKTLL